MNEPSHIGALLREYVERARTLAAKDACPEHVYQRAVHCSGCGGDAKASRDPERLREWETVQAMVASDELFPRRYRDALPTDPATLRWVSAVADSLEEAPSLLLLGPTGVGKTYQAYGALRGALLRRPRASWATSTFADFAAALRPHPKADPEVEMQRFRGVDLLLIDDLAAAKNSEWVEEITYRLVNGRYEDMRPTIFTTNFAVADLKDIIGDRVASRLAETCIRVVLEGGDRRRHPKAA